MGTQRNYAIDIVKGIGIIAVVLGHTCIDWELNRYFSNFRMPLFFFISGILFSKDKYPDFTAFCKHKITTLLVPYAFFYLITYFYWVFIERHIRADIGQDTTWYYPLIGLVYGVEDGTNLMINNIVLWFIPCLFSTQLLFYLFTRISDRKKVIFPLLCLSGWIGYIVSDFPKQLPFGLSIAFVAVIFYAAGYYSKSLIRFLQQKKILNAAIFIAGLCLYIWLTHKTYNRVNMVIMIYGKPEVFFSSAFLGILLCFSLSIWIARNPVLEYIGKNTMVIVGLHVPLNRAVCYVYAWLKGTPVDVVRTSVPDILIIGTIILILLLPCIQMYNKYISERLTTLSRSYVKPANRPGLP